MTCNSECRFPEFSEPAVRFGIRIYHNKLDELSQLCARSWSQFFPKRAFRAVNISHTRRLDYLPYLSSTSVPSDLVQVFYALSLATGEGQGCCKRLEKSLVQIIQEESQESRQSAAPSRRHQPKPLQRATRSRTLSSSVFSLE